MTNKLLSRYWHTLQDSLFPLYKYPLPLFLLTLTAMSSMDASDRPSELLSHISQKVPLTMTLKDGISESLIGADAVDAIVTLLSNRGVETVVDHSREDNSLQLGFTYPPESPWSILAAVQILKIYKDTGKRVLVADWACGKGFSTMQAVVAGANANAIEQHKPAADEANKNIWSIKSKVNNSQFDLKNNYKVFHGSVTNPGTKFMERRNQVSIVFNILHQLKPKEADQLLLNVWNNLESAGIAFICTDTTYPLPKMDPTYSANVACKKKYPGYGIVNLSELTVERSRETTYLVRSLKDIPDEQKIEMGTVYPGSYPPNNYLGISDTNILRIHDPRDTRFNKFIDPDSQIHDILSSQAESYTVQNTHRPMNLFDYLSLKNLVEGFGFTVINAWYTNPTTNILSPCEGSPIDKKLVMAVIKPEKKL